MKIGMLSTSKQLNYGGILQAFAMLEVVRATASQAEVETINIDITLNSEELVGEPYPSLFRIWKKAVLKRLAIRFFHPLGMLRHCRRRRRTLSFLGTHLRQGAHCHHSPDNLFADADHDLFVVGSDQVWRYQSRIHEYCLLGGLPRQRARRLAYAASLGWSELPEQHRSKYIESLRRFDAISVREPSSVETIKALLEGEKNVSFCVDPTLLFGRDRWVAFLKDLPPIRRPESPYAFVYWLNDLQLLEPVFQGLQAAGYERIVVVFSWYKKVLSGSLFKTKRLLCEMKRKYGVVWTVDAGPAEFLSLLANASYVVANSFHAMMFSMIFHKPARIYVKVNGPRDPMAPRLLDFAERYDIDGVVYEGVEGHCDFASSPSLDFDAIWRRIEPDRRHSMTFLLDALKQCGVPVSSTVDEVL